jgi:hypothetical protein
MIDHSKSPFLQRPSTRTGWWALGLAIAFEVMDLINSFVFMRLNENVPWRLTVLPFFRYFHDVVWSGSRYRRVDCDSAQPRAFLACVAVGSGRGIRIVVRAG